MSATSVQSYLANLPYKSSPPLSRIPPAFLPMRLLYVCDADGGGIAEYAIRQFHALGGAGVEVTFLCRSSFDTNRIHRPEILPILPASPARHPSPVIRLMRMISDAKAVARAAVKEAERGHYDALLIACYAEYFSPFWAGTFRRAARQGLVIGSVAHDPVRDYVFGPLWWHRWSVRQAYSFVKHVFVHDDTSLDFGGSKPAGIRIHRIPHGPFEVSPPSEGRAAARARYGFSDDDRIFLSFGQIRDGKNLDRFLRAMVRLPEHIKLLVAGSSGGGAQRQPEEYQYLAREFAVSERCVWDIRYIPDEETGGLFAAADVVLMTYSTNFRSASGVLNTAVYCRKLVLASSGEGPLRTAVEDYHLGVYVMPDDDEAIISGAKQLLEQPPKPDWQRYERENSWEENARRVAAAFSGRKF
jgi:glycosyltransferase involved in cell wall biosynthesis